MRPIKLIMNAFGPYASKAEVVFEELETVWAELCQVYDVTAKR